MLTSLHTPVGPLRAHAGPCIAQIWRSPYSHAGVSCSAGWCSHLGQKQQGTIGGADRGHGSQKMADSKCIVQMHCASYISQSTQGSGLQASQCTLQGQAPPSDL